jgi:hypothetical protein
MPRMSLVASGRTSLLALLCLLASGCCFTNALWVDDDEELGAASVPNLVRVVTGVTRHEHRVDVAVVVRDQGVQGLRLRSLDGPDADGFAAWQLSPAAGDDLACTLLADLRQRGRCSLRIDVARDRDQGDIVWSEATVVLQGVLDLGDLGGPVDPASLSPSVRERLDAASVAQDAFARPAPRADGTDWVRRFDERVRTADLRALTPGETAPWVPYAVVLVGSDGRPWQPPVAAAPASTADKVVVAVAGPEPAVPVEPPRSREIVQLGGLAAVIVATNGTITRTFQLRAERASLWSQLGGRADGHFDTTSKWRFLADASAVDPSSATTMAQTAAAAEVWPLTVTDRNIVWDEREPESSEDFFGKLALTPLAIAGDLLFGWMLSAIGVEACGCDDDDDEPRRR